MSHSIELLILITAIAFSVPVAMFCLEVALSLLPCRDDEPPALDITTRLAVLIPAHNEQDVIAGTLHALLPTVPPGCRIVVVADNCTDTTARIAREAGAEVVERHDAARRGKGFALDLGIRHLARNEPEAVIFLDADCRVSADTVRLLAAAAIASGRPVQGLNLCHCQAGANAGQAISAFAFRFKNLVRMLGLARLAGLVHLTGTGMALPWTLAGPLRLDGNVVEDMQLGIDLAVAGRPARFLPAARVDSPLPRHDAGTRTQRTRWEHGHLQTMLVQAPRLLAQAIRARRIDLAWLALDLAIPPLSLLVLALSASTTGAGLLAAHGLAVPTFSLLAAAWLTLVSAVLVGWAVHCRRDIPAGALAAIPLYALKKLPIYLGFIIARQRQWIRTERDTAPLA